MKTISELDKIVNELMLLIPNIKNICDKWDDLSQIYEEYISYLEVSGVTLQT